MYDCVYRNRRLPDLLVLDQAPEFVSDDLDIALAYLGVDKLERPAAHPRYGSVQERLFGAVHTRFVHEQSGSTESVLLGRMLSASHRPERTAEWTLRAFHPVVERWLFDDHPKLIHASLGVPLGEIWDRSLARCGEHVARYIACDDALRAVLSQTVDGDTRKVNDGGTVFVNHLYFTHPALDDARVLGTRVAVKLCLADASYVYVRVPYLGEWVRAVVCDGDADLAGLTWRAVNCALEELRGQRRVGRSKKARTHNAALVGRALVHARDSASPTLVRQVERDEEQAGLAASGDDRSQACTSHAVLGSDSRTDDDIDYDNLKGF